LKENGAFKQQVDCVLNLAKAMEKKEVGSGFSIYERRAVYVCDSGIIHRRLGDIFGESGFFILPYEFKYR
jgi:hypothetical protein